MRSVCSFYHPARRNNLSPSNKNDFPSNRNDFPSNKNNFPSNRNNYQSNRNEIPSNRNIWGFHWGQGREPPLTEEERMTSTRNVPTIPVRIPVIVRNLGSRQEFPELGKSLKGLSLD